MTRPNSESLKGFRVLQEGVSGFGFFELFIGHGPQKRFDRNVLTETFCRKALTESCPPWGGVGGVVGGGVGGVGGGGGGGGEGKKFK